ncbi:MAG: sulfatase-like hydrolase/transferase [Saprospiraceae bacterium]
MVKHLSALFYFLVLFVFSAQAQNPNVIVIVADDLGVDPLAAYHDAQRTATTPILDSLIAEGLLFENIFAPPKCTPSRAAMLSGKYGIKTGVTGTPGTLDTVHHSLFREVERLQPNVYANAVIGKWHLKSPNDPNDPARHGVQHFDGVMDSGVSSYFNWQRTTNGIITTDTGYTTSVLTDEAINWIGNQNQPWLLWLAHPAPHTPIHVPPAELFTVSNTNNNLGKYIAMIEAMDTEIGRLLSSLTPSQKANTVVIFVGDNGTPSSVLQDYPQGHGKTTLYQGGVRVPFFISGAGVTRKGQRESALVHVADIFATVLALTGSTESPGTENSLNLVPYLDGTQVENRIYNYSEIGRETPSGWAMRTVQYKLITFDDATQEFYDLIADSLETTNLLVQGLTQAQLDVKADLEAEAAQQRDDYSCRDFIQNGDEEGIDCGGSSCSPCTSPTAEVSTLNVQLSPNPMSDQLLIRTEGSLIKYVEVFDLRGRLLRRISGINTAETRLSLTDISPQTLIVRMRIDDQVLVRQVIKQ